MYAGQRALSLDYILDRFFASSYSELKALCLKKDLNFVVYIKKTCTSRHSFPESLLHLVH